MTKRRRGKSSFWHADGSLFGRLALGPLRFILEPWGTDKRELRRRRRRDAFRGTGTTSAARRRIARRRKIRNQMARESRRRNRP